MNIKLLVVLALFVTLFVISVSTIYSAENDEISPYFSSVNYLKKSNVNAREISKADVSKAEISGAVEEIPKEKTSPIKETGIKSAGSGYLWLLKSDGHVYKVSLSTESSVFDFYPSELYIYFGVEWDGSYLWVMGPKGPQPDGVDYLQKYSESGALYQR